MASRYRDPHVERSSARYSEELLAEQRRRKRVDFPPRGITGRDYQSRVNVQEEQRLAREGAPRGAPESPAITAMGQQAQETWARMQQESAIRQEEFDYQARLRRYRSQVSAHTARGFGGVPGIGEDIVLPGPPPGVSGGMVGGGRARPTPKEQAQNWSDVNTAANAEIVPEGGVSIAKPMYNLFGRSHLDTSLIAMGRDATPKDIWKSYQAQTKVADTKLSIALSSRAGEFTTLDEAKLFISSLGFDDRVGQHIDNRMTQFLSRSQPELYRQLVGEQKAESANDSSFVQWVKQNDPAAAGLTSEQILANRTPEQDFAFDQDINARHYEYDPVTGREALRPERKLTAIEEMQEQQKVLQYQADQDPDLMVKAGKLVSRKKETDKRLGEIRKELDDLEASSQRNRFFAYEHSELLTPNELLEQNATYKSRKAALERERDQLLTGGGPAVEGALAAESPVMTPEEAAVSLPERLTDPDTGKTYVKRGAPAGPVSVVGTPARGKGSVEMGDKTLTTEDLAAQREAVSSIMMGGRTVTAPVHAPVVQPVAEAAPYMPPIATREDIIQQAKAAEVAPFAGPVARRKDIVERALAAEPPPPAPLPTKYGDFSPEIRAQVEKMTPPDISTTRILKDIGKSAGKKLIDTAGNVIDATKGALAEAPEVVSDAVIWYLKIPWTEAKFIAKFGAKKLDEVLEPRKQAILEEWKMNAAKELAKKGKK